jgi:mRNA interferase MazF
VARGDIFIVNLPNSEGREQSGRRPAVALQTDVAGTPLLMVAPITSNLKALRFAYSVRIEPTKENGLSVPSVVMIFQMRAIDKTRIIHRIGQVSAEDMKRIDIEIGHMFRPVDSE